ncbi:MAG: O-antigen ligase family protein [Gemmatimonadales bacterium]
MELIDIPITYLLLPAALWAISFYWLVRNPEWIAASVLVVFFFMPAALDVLFADRTIPTGQIVVLLFLPPLMVSLTMTRSGLHWFDLGLLVAYGGCIVVSILVNDLPFWSNKSALVPVLFAVVLYLSVDSKKALHRLLLVYMALILLNTVFAGIQRAGYDWAYLPSELRLANAGGFRRGVGLSGHFAMAGLYATVAVPVGAALFIDAARSSHRVMAFLLGLLGLAGVAFSVLRTALLGAVLGSLAVLWCKKSLRALGALIVLGVLVGIVTLVAPPFRNAAVSIVEHSASTDESALARPRLARMGLDAWAQSPILGGGPGAVDSYVHRSADPHNTFVNVLAETGGIGLLTFLLILSRAYYLAVRAARRDCPTEGIALAGALVATLPIAFFHSLNYITLFWFIPALCLGLGRFPYRGMIRRRAQTVDPHVRIPVAP